MLRRWVPVLAVALAVTLTPGARADSGQYRYPIEDLGTTTVIPDPAGTPGAHGHATRVQLCRLVKAHRSPTLHLSSEGKRAVYTRYGLAYPQPKGLFEIDALIPLSLGGTTTLANLWPQPSTGTAAYPYKDHVEHELLTAMCEGKLTLGRARHLATEPVVGAGVLEALRHPTQCPPTCTTVASGVGINLSGIQDPVIIGSPQRAMVSGSIGGPHYSCRLAINRPDGQPLKSSTLGIKPADFQGGWPAMPTWSWTADPDSPPGIAHMKATCYYKGKVQFTAKRSLTFAHGTLTT